MKQLLKKKVCGISIVWFYGFILLTLIGIIIGSFADKGISMKLYDKNNGYGLFFESFGTALGYMMVPCGATCVFLGLRKYKKWWVTTLRFILLIGASLAAGYIYGGSLYEGKEEYGLLVSKLPAYGFAFFMMGLAILLTYMFVDKKESRNLIVVGTVILLAMVIQLVLLNFFLKYLAGRPRWRYLQGDALDPNGINESFRAWWEMQPFKYKSGDYHKSWPSGHTATATIVTLLPLLGTVAEKKYKYEPLVFFVFGVCYTFTMAFARIVAGAHFLSDVSFGSLFSLCAIVLSLYLGEFMNKKLSFRFEDKA